jgi:phosphohistidine phosphatase
MNLYIIRHADALPRGQDGVADEERPLTDKGREQCRKVAQALLRHGAVLNSLISSPLVRAQQTAEEIRQHWSPSAPTLQVCEELAPGRRFKKLVRWLVGLGEENVGLVGHEPDLSKFIAWLIGSKQAQLNLVKAGVAAVACDGTLTKGCGTLQWLVTPKWMEEPALAKAR